MSPTQNFSNIIGNSYIMHLGKTSFCPGDSTILQATKGNGLTYQWFRNNDSISGSVSSSFEAKDSGLYNVSISNAMSCHKMQRPVAVSIFPLPATPIISAAGDTLISTANSGNQWYANDSLVAGETNKSYIPYLSGTYTVSVTDSNGCIATSASYIYSFTGIGKILFSGNLNIYPNPSHNTFNIQITGENLKEAEVNLSDIVGNKVTTFSINNEKEFTLNASDYNLQQGVYILSIRSGSSVYIGKLVVE